MTDPLDPVRAVMQAPEDIEMAGVPVAGDPDADGTGPDFELSGDPGPDPDDRGGPGADDPDLPPLVRCIDLPLNDIGNARRFVIHFGTDLLYVPRVGWYCWTGQVWKIDPDIIAIRRLGQQISPLIEAEIPLMGPPPEYADLIARAAEIAEEFAALDAIAIADRDAAQKSRYTALARQLDKIAGARKALVAARQAVRKHARATGNFPKIKALIDVGQTHLARALEGLDADPLIVNTLSGAIRFTPPDEATTTPARFDILPHAREQLLTKMMPVEFKPGAACPQFLAFLARVQPDRNVRDFLQRWFGLSLTGLTGEQKLVFLHGGGANGKSVLVDLMAKIMGDYSATAKIESLTGINRRSGSEATPDLFMLIGARMVRASEPEAGEPLQEAKIKELTGGEPMKVRTLNADFVDFLPLFKLTISGNHKPEVRGNDDGIWRRLLLVPFDIQIPKDERDKHLGAKLWAEREGIFQWMVEGLLEYLHAGLREPQVVLSATAEYREESDPLGQFITDCCVVTGDRADSILSSKLTFAFNYWQLERGVTQWQGKTIQRQMKPMARHWKHPQTGLQFFPGKSSLARYEGIKLTDVFSRRFDAAPKDATGKPIGTAPEQPDDNSSRYGPDFGVPY